MITALSSLAPMLMIVAVLLLFPARYSHRWLLLPALLFYLLAKYAEYHDAECYARIGLFSGHTLKHLLAAISCGMVLWQLQLRRPV